MQSDDVFWVDQPYTMDVYTYVRIYTLQLGWYIGMFSESFIY